MKIPPCSWCSNPAQILATMYPDAEERNACGFHYHKLLEGEYARPDAKHGPFLSLRMIIGIHPEPNEPESEELEEALS